MSSRSWHDRLDAALEVSPQGTHRATMNERLHAAGLPEALGMLEQARLEVALLQADLSEKRLQALALVRQRDGLDDELSAAIGKLTEIGLRA